MAVSMMMAEVGGMPKVSGSSSATPGDRPDARQGADEGADDDAGQRHQQVEGREAIEKPRIRLSKTSMPAPQNPRTLTGKGTWSQ